MKFIGQYIQQFIARFRADVFLENISTSSETGVLVVDSDGKITKNTSISGGVAGTVTVADESTDTTCFPAFVTAATGDLPLKTGSNLSFNSNTGALTATSFVGPLTGNASTATASASNFTVNGDLTVTGNDIKDNDGTTCITFDSSGNTTIQNDLTVGAQEDGDATLIISADTDNGTGEEGDNARLWFKQDGDITEGAIQMSSNKLNIINNISGAGGISFQTGTTDNTGTTDPATGATERMSISSAGDVTISSSLTVDDVNIDGPIITITGSTNDTFAIRTTTDGETIFSTTDTAGAEAHMNFNPDGEFRVTSDDTIFKSTTSAHPTVKIENNTADATSGELVFYNERHGGNGVGNDELGSISFKGPNGDRSDAEFNFATIVGKNIFPNDTDEAGLIEIKVATSDGSTSALQSGVGIIGHPTANTTIVQLGYSTSCSAVVSGKLSAPRRQFFKTGTTDGTHDGDVVYFGSTTSMTTGAIYFYNASGNWELTDADGVGKSSGLLGVALGSASDTDGVLLRGMVTLNHDPGAIGDILYLSTTGGQCSSTSPSGSGDIIRIVGYCLDASNGQIWFNPDNTFVEYTT